MARQRDYGKEYAARKAKAAREGFSSPRTATRRRTEARRTGQPVDKTPRKPLSPAVIERRAYGFKSKAQLDSYMSKLITWRPTSSEYLTPKRLEELRAKGWSDAKIANQHRVVFGKQSPVSIRTMVSSDKWIKLKSTKTWYVQVLGMYTSKEYDEKYGLTK